METKTPPPRRKRLQMHLSTAVWMMVAAGGIIWGNVEQRAALLYARDSYDYAAYSKLYGWPFDAAGYQYWVRQSESYVNRSVRKTNWAYSTGGIAGNSIVALAILFAVWYVSEWWIRRRAGRRS